VLISYDSSHKVAVITVTYLENATTAPPPKDVLGIDLETKGDGSGYKLIRYPKSGYSVSYSRTAGDSVMITIAMKKL
jgi:hypothetical protein